MTSFDKFWTSTYDVTKDLLLFMPGKEFWGPLDCITTLFCPSFKMSILRHLCIPMGRCMGLDVRKAGHGSQFGDNVSP